MKLKVGAKITGGFSILTILLAIVSFLGIYGALEAQKNYDEIVNKNTSVAFLVMEIKAITLEQVSAIRGYILYGDEKYPELYNELNTKLDVIYEEIEQKIETEQSRKYLALIKKSHDGYDADAQYIIKSEITSNKEDILKKAGDGRIYVNQIKGTADAWLNFVEKLNKGIIHDVDKHISNINKFLIILFIVSIVISVGCVLYLIKLISKPLVKLTNIAEKLANGDLSQDVPVIKTGDEIENLSEAFSIMVKNLKEMIEKINVTSKQLSNSSEDLAASSEEVVAVSEQISNAIMDLAKGASVQAESTTQGNIKIMEITEGLNEIVGAMNTSKKLTDNSLDKINLGEKAVKYQEVKMNESKQISLNVKEVIVSLLEKSNEIGDIVKVIQGISEQTNLLSLNAAIEAARAGEHGKGFSVVADEVRKLAEQTNLSVVKVGEIIKHIQNLIEQSSLESNKEQQAIIDQEKALKETISAFKGIKEEVITITNNINEVTEYSGSLNKNAKQAQDSISSIASISQEVAASTEELSASSEEQTATMQQVASSAEELAQLSNELQSCVKKFKL